MQGYRQEVYQFKGYDFSYQEMKKILVKNLYSWNKELSAHIFLESLHGLE